MRPSWLVIAAFLSVASPWPSTASGQAGPVRSMNSGGNRINRKSHGNSRIEAMGECATGARPQSSASSASSEQSPCDLFPAAATEPTGHALPLGVTHRDILDARGPWRVHVLTVDLRRGDLEIRHERALGQLRGRERPSDMVRRVRAAGTDVIAAVNADFFDLATGESENNQVIGGTWWKGEKVTDSPYDTFDNPHTQLGFDARGRPLLDRFILDATASAHGVAVPILTVNLRPTAVHEGTTLYTPRYGETTPRDTTRRFAEVALGTVGRRGDTLLYLPRGTARDSSATRIPRDGAVLSGYGARATAVRAMADGDTIRVLLGTRPRLGRQASLSMLIGGWPRILRDGRSVADDAASVEGTISRNAEMRHPRTAVGFSRDSTRLILLTVDGRSEDSGGMTLGELAAAMRRFGAWQAMNFDGGGSTTMVVGDSVVNHPSDAEGERTVGSALVVVRRSPPKRMFR